MNFYDGLNRLQPHRILENFIKNNTEIRTAVDLGCGAGRDTKFLIKKGINVTAIDRVDVTKFLNEGLNDDEKQKLIFIQSQFQNVELPKVDMVISYEALPFSNMESIRKIISKIKEALKDDGYFLCNFFGKKDSWVGNDKITFVDEKEIKDLLKDLKILKLNEMEQDGETAMHQIKHWHVYWVIAKKELKK